jgi:hypothetical protein
MDERSDTVLVTDVPPMTPSVPLIRAHRLAAILMELDQDAYVHAMLPATGNLAIVYGVEGCELSEGPQGLEIRTNARQLQQKGWIGLHDRSINWIGADPIELAAAKLIGTKSGR